MIAFILAGLVLGGIYAISAASIVVTYVSAGVLNFAFGAIAFFIARLYYYLVVQAGWPVYASAIVAIAITGPLLGVALYFALFRFLTQAQAITKVVATIGLSVAIPAATELMFGNRAILTSPGLAPLPVRVFHVGGVAITLDQLIAYCCVAAVLVAGTYVLRRTQVGLMVRATVDSKAMTSLTGISPGRIAVGVWAVGTFLAGLAGVLAAPVLNVSSVSNYTVITASAFAAVVAARLRSLPIAVVVGLIMGVAGSLLQWALPSVSSQVTGDIIAAIPFAIVVIFLLGMISLCQITFAGIGGMAAAQVNSTYHLPVLLGVVVGGLLAGVGGLIVGALTARMGNLYAALATLTFGLLFSSIVFQLNVFLQYGAGVTVSRPSFASSNIALTYFTLALFVLISLFIAAIRGSTAGLALAAIRTSETGARSAGISVVRMKITVWALAATIAGIGGGMYVIYTGAALPQSFDTIIGLTWFAVVITNGRRSNNAALAGGLFYVLIPQLFATYLPSAWGPLPTLLFGVGAVLLARNPEGIITMNGRQLAALARRLTRSGRPGRESQTPGGVPASAAATELEDVQ